MWATEEWWPSLGAASVNSAGDLYCDLTTMTVDNTGGIGYGTIDYYNYQWRMTYRVRDNTNQVSNNVEVLFWGNGAQVVPIALDLDGDGLELVSLDDSPVAYSMSDTKQTMRTGWIGADDAFLALDRNADGAITGRTEISFVDDVPGATSDLEGLVAFDTNGDGALSAGDARFSEFLVWQDANQDGISQGEELLSLADRGIESISLTRNLTGEVAQSEFGNVITATAEMRRSDGSIGVVGDVTLGYLEANVEVLSETPVAPATGTVTTEQETAVDSPAPLNVELAKEAPAAAALAETAQQEAAPSNEPEPRAPREDKGLADSATDTNRSRAGASESWEYSGTPAQGALHAGLSLVAQRRLQMIDAMASFSAEGASSLDLQPHRRVDSRTLELLTAVGGVRSAA